MDDLSRHPIPATVEWLARGAVALQFLRFTSENIISATAVGPTVVWAGTILAIIGIVGFDVEAVLEAVKAYKETS